HGDHGRGDDPAAPRHPHRRRLQATGLASAHSRVNQPEPSTRITTEGPPMLQWLAQFLTAPIINGFLNAHKAKLAAANAQGAQAVEVARTALMAEIEARKSANAVILAEEGRWYTAIIRPLLAAPVVIYLWKVIVWDIVLGLGTTDPIGGDVAEWA